MNSHPLFFLIILLFLVSCGDSRTDELLAEPAAPKTSCHNASQKITNQAVSNWAVVADAGKNQQVAPGSEVALDASSSFSQPNNEDASTACKTSLNYSWSIIDQPTGSQPVINNVNAVNPRLKTDVEGTYRLKLEVSTENGVTETSEVTIDVDPKYQRPNIQVDAGKNQFVGTNSNVSVNEGNGTVINGDNITYQWTTVNNLPSPTVIQNITNIINVETTEFQPLTFSPDIAGDYQFKLMIKNSEITNEDVITIKVDAGKNSIPVANAGKDIHHRVNDTVTLTAANSYDADADQLTYQWFFSTKPNSSQATLDTTDTKSPSFTVDVEGTYVATLRVRDGKEVSSDNISSEFDSIMIIVSSGGNPPTAFAGANFSMMTGATVRLYGGGSYDVDGDSLSYQWSVTTSPDDSVYTLLNDTTASPNFTPENTGNYTIQLIATDSSGINSEAVTMTVSANESVVKTDDNPPITTASVQTGSYNTAQSIVLTCSDPGGSGCKNTYFTIDESEPSKNSSIYSTAININENTTLKYFSTDQAGNIETTITKTYTIDIPTSFTLTLIRP